MNLYYAMGGGLGHLTRAFCFLRQFNLINDSFILTSSEFADDKRVVGDVRIIKVDKDLDKNISNFQSFLKETLTEFSIKTIYVDSFPLGIIGELADFEFGEIEINYIARFLRWSNYSKFIRESNLKFTQTFILEPLENEHRIYVDAHSASQTKLGLVYKKSIFSEQDEDIAQNIAKTHSPFWLIVHSGNDEEILELVNYAEEMREVEKAKVDLVLISPSAIKSGNLFQYNLYPASILFDKAERIFSGCGFNIMKQTEDFADKHFFIPFERRFDNQFHRAKKRYENLEKQ